MNEAKTQQKFLNHKLYGIWTKVPVNYYQKGVRTNIFKWIWHSHKIRFAKVIMNKLDFNTCLDVGCASGYMISQIAKSFPHAQYYGVDVHDKAVLSAKKSYPDINFTVSSADNLPFKQNSLDLILFYETIEHVEDPLKSLKEIRRILRPKGTLLLAMDSGSFLFRVIWFVWEKSFGKAWQGAHLHPFHHDHLESIVKQAGFKIKKKLFSHFGMEVIFILKK